MLTFTLLKANIQVMNGIYCAGVLFLLIRMFNEKFFDLDECGIEGRGVESPNIMISMVGMFSYLFILVPASNYYHQLQQDKQGAEITAKTLEKIRKNFVASALTTGFCVFLDQRYQRQIPLVAKVFMYIISSRGFIKALLLLKGLRATKEDANSSL